MLKMPLLKLLKKTSVAAVVMTITPMALAETDWKEVISLAPYSPPVTFSYDDKGFIEMGGIQLPNGKFRLNKIRNFQASRKPRLYVDLPAGTKDIEKQCQIALKSNKPFKAILKFTVNPMLQPGSFAPKVKVTTSLWKQDTILLPSVEFDNPYVLGPVKVEFSKFDMKFSKDPNEPEHGQLWWMIKDFYLNLLNSQAQNVNGADATIDLSTMNGFACDLMLGKIQLKVTQTATYIPGAAERYDWLSSQDAFLQIFKNYWNDEAFYYGENNKTVTEEDRAFLLGLQHQFPVDNSVILLTQSRLKNLIASLTFNVEALSSAEKDRLNKGDLSQNFYMTSSFSKPNYGDLDTVHELVISDVETFTTTISEMK